MDKVALNFMYLFCFLKEGDTVHTIMKNSPYKSLTQVDDDISVIFHGRDLAGNECPNYKTINWEALEDGVYWTKIKIKYIPNKDETFDQIFELQGLEKGSKDTNPFCTGECNK